MNLAQGVAQECPAVITPSNPAAVCQPDAVTLAANSGPGLTYQWQKDGVDVPNATGVTFTAAASGNYTVRVTGPSCTAKTSTPVTVTITPQPAQPTFLVNPNIVQCAGTPIGFSIVNPLPNTNYVWDFGDGTTSTGDFVQHAYNSVGNGTVTFTAQVYAVTQGGCTSPARSTTISVAQKPAFSPPKDSSNFIVCVPDSQKVIKQTASLLNPTPVPNNIVSYVVDFGDGAGPRAFTAGDFTATKPIRNTVPYDTTGAFKISIRAIGSNGCDSVYTIDYQISRKPKAGFTTNKERVDPAACVPVKVTVDTDSSSGGNLSYKWKVLNKNGQEVGNSDMEYLDNTTDTTQNPIFSFKNKGRFTIKLFVSNTCGTDSTEQSVLIALPEVQMNADSTACGAPTTIRFNADMVQFDANLGTISGYKWTISGTSGATAVNGTTLQDMTPEIRFPNVGVYTVTVVATNECGASDEVEQQMATATITVNEIPGAPTFTTASTTICNETSALLRPTGPGTTYNFYSEPAGGTPLKTGRDYTTDSLNSATTFYVASVTPQGCESATRTPFTVNVTPGITDNSISVEAGNQEICAGSSPGTLAGTAAKEGTNTPAYVWQKSTTNETTGFTTIAGATAQDYAPGPLAATTWFRRIARSNFSCPSDTSNVAVVNVSPAIEGNTINVGTGRLFTICEGSTAPEITGTAIAGVSYLWESSNNATDGFTAAPGVNNQQNYSPGVLTQTTFYRRRVISSACDQASAVVVEIRVTPKLTNNVIEGNQEICATGSAPAPLTGTVPTGGTLNRTYRWQSSLNGNAEDFQTAAGNSTGQNYSPAVLTQTTFFRRLVSSEGCDSLSSNVVKITVSAPVNDNTITAAQTSVCQNTTTSFTGSVATGGSGTLSYQWQQSTTNGTDGFQNIAGATSQNYTPVATNLNTWYRRLVTSAGNTCLANASNVILISVQPSPVAPTVEATNVTSCAGESVTLRASGTGGVFEWFTSPEGGTPVFIGPEFQTGPLTASTSYYVQAKNTNQCVSVTRTQVQVTVSNAVADAGPDATIIEGQAVTLRGSGGATYLWTPATGLSSATVANPAASPIFTTTYTLQVTDANGCTDTDEVTVTVIGGLKIVNTFSPNGDGVNETWDLGNVSNFPDISIEIFNRWGQRVYTSKGYATPWDGTYNGKALPVDTYYYIIRLNQEENPLKGSVTIIK
ncbi:T9SS type B sorting domain-containing protein [Nibribacter ruber]|uniref:T9SS type B sorting domain-containing protein n=1 Tax=Nibribacter ruber TaxID=2698458 RepID=A0A6P1NXL7_9BACT|nr:gliding motility-associated C-terminal domain-containing protein [Nibribacter ruber]QHL86658.1 T9SS type B sorting domain-containing protein [Nibribacter ruber]